MIILWLVLALFGVVVIVVGSRGNLPFLSFIGGFAVGFGIIQFITELLKATS